MAWRHGKDAHSPGLQHTAGSTTRRCWVMLQAAGSVLAVPWQCTKRVHHNADSTSEYSCSNSQPQRHWRETWKGGKDATSQWQESAVVSGPELCCLMLYVDGGIVALQIYHTASISKHRRSKSWPQQRCTQIWRSGKDSYDLGEESTASSLSRQYYATLYVGGGVLAIHTPLVHQNTAVNSLPTTTASGKHLKKQKRCAQSRVTIPYQLIVCAACGVA
jgi:hypothetical protein